MPLPSIGYACINLSLNSKKICPNHTCRLATIQKHHQIGGSSTVLKFLQNLSLENLRNLKIIIQWHLDHNMRFYRLSSDMFPHISQPELINLMTPEDLQSYITLGFARPALSEISLMAYQKKMRLTMHPGQFNQLGSTTESVVEKTFIDLTWQNRILDIMEEAIYATHGVSNAMKDSILCIHGGGVYKDKPTTIRRWITNFKKLPPEIKRRIALENCEKSYCAEDVLPICQELKIPMIFDFHHYNCYSLIHPEFKQKPISELLPLILDTWKVRDMKPKFHLSDQAKGKSIGAHHDYVQCIPPNLLDLIETTEFDIMIEAKCKDLAVFQLHLKYPQLRGDVIIPNNFVPLSDSIDSVDNSSDCCLENTDMNCCPELIPVFISTPKIKIRMLSSSSTTSSNSTIISNSTTSSIPTLEKKKFVIRRL